MYQRKCPQSQPDPSSQSDKLTTVQRERKSPAQFHSCAVLELQEIMQASSEGDKIHIKRKAH